MARERKSDPPPPPPELGPDDAARMVDAIRKIDKAVKSLHGAGLSRRAIVVLLADATEVGKRDINAVLNGLDQLAELYLEKTK